MLEVHRIQDADTIFPHRQRFELFGRLNINNINNTKMNIFWTIFEIFLKGSKKLLQAIKKRFYFGFSFIERIIVDKMYFEKRPPQKSKGINLNFLTILDHYITNLVQKS